jgi:hypothetical protein
MSFKSREKKRGRKLAMGNVRAKHGEAMAGRHYLTIVSRHSCQPQPRYSDQRDAGGRLRITSGSRNVEGRTRGLSAAHILDIGAMAPLQSRNGSKRACT